MKPIHVKNLPHTKPFMADSAKRTELIAETRKRVLPELLQMYGYEPTTNPSYIKTPQVRSWFLGECAMCELPATDPRFRSSGLTGYNDLPVGMYTCIEKTCHFRAEISNVCYMIDHLQICWQSEWYHPLVVGAAGMCTVIGIRIGHHTGLPTVYFKGLAGSFGRTFDELDTIVDGLSDELRKVVRMRHTEIARIPESYLKMMLGK